MKCYWNSRADLYGPVQIPRLVLKLDIGSLDCCARRLVLMRLIAIISLLMFGLVETAATLDEDPTEVRSWGRIVASPTLGFG
jgi:hypothetical protein